MPATRFTDAQLVKALTFFGSISGVAEALGLSHRALQRRFARMRRRGVVLPPPALRGRGKER